MKSKTTIFSAALAVSSLLNPSAQAAVNEYQITISGAGDPTTVFTVPANIKPASTNGYSFSIGPIEQLTNGVVVGDTYFFNNISAGGGLSDRLTYADHGAQLFSGPVSNPTLLTGVFIEENADSGNIDRIEVASIPEFATWAMMLAGFAGIAMAGHHHKLYARLPE
jgi:hypothetical protein